MARASQTTQPIVRTGLAPTMTIPAASPNGDVIDTGRCFLMVKTGTDAITVTVQTPITVDGLDLDDLSVSVGASTTKLIGPFPVSTFGQTSDSAASPADVGRAYVDYTGTLTSVTRAVISL